MPHIAAAEKWALDVRTSRSTARAAVLPSLRGCSMGIGAVSGTWVVRIGSRLLMGVLVFSFCQGMFGLSLFANSWVFRIKPLNVKTF